MSPVIDPEIPEFQSDLLLVADQYNNENAHNLTCEYYTNENL